MVVAWLLTVPAAGLVGALMFTLSHSIAGLSSVMLGDLAIFGILVAVSFYMWWRAQQQKVDHTNVNADWDADTNSVLPAEFREVGAVGDDATRVEPIARAEAAEDRVV
jgi:PiT family inorganic phosphate transporter